MYILINLCIILDLQTFYSHLYYIYDLPFTFILYNIRVYFCSSVLSRLHSPSCPLLPHPVSTHHGVTVGGRPLYSKGAACWGPSHAQGISPDEDGLLITPASPSCPDYPQDFLPLLLLGFFFFFYLFTRTFSPSHSTTHKSHPLHFVTHW